MHRLYQLQCPTIPLVDNKHAEYRLVESGVGLHLFIADGSRLYGIEAPLDEVLRESLHDAALVESLLGDYLNSENERAIGMDILSPPPLHSLSLNVAQSCNMACSYCYADEGRFGRKPRMMDEAVAIQAIDRLLLESDPGEPVLVGFMGGEPLLNRELVHRAVRYAIDRAGSQEVRFSMTTNGTMITERDARLFHEFPFTIQISIDGNREQNDRARPMRSGGSSYDHILRTLDTLNAIGRPRQLSARVTVTPSTRGLPSILQHLLGLGFDDVGFAPVLVSPDPDAAFSSLDFDHFLDEMKACGRLAMSELKLGRPFPFSNLMTALNEIHRGTHRPYPCGAGAAYLSVNAEGELFACHRLIDDPGFYMGDVSGGLDQIARSQHLSRMHVDKMQPCQSCWARYLCGGGCYHEVASRGRPGCDYIRGWIEFCIAAYAELSSFSSLAIP